VIDNHDWTNDGTLTGLSAPDGDFVDAEHNLYVADYANFEIAEFAHGSTSPTFIYNEGINDPINVATDKSGNVYAANWNHGANGGVFEYAQGNNVTTNICSVTGGVEGIAVDKSGDVFIDSVNSGYAGVITEFVGGLSGCHGKTLSISGLGGLGGMAIDKSGNLIVVDQTNAKVDVIAPPYSSITGTLGSGFSGPFHVTLNETNKEAYVADTGTGVIDVLSYPSGKLIDAIGSSSGLVNPWAAVYGSNAVY
jgi:DNA-binding beta-propeller fold protein YncE